MNDTDLTNFLRPIGNGSSWTAKCVRRLLNAENLTEIIEGLVAHNGHKPVEHVKGVWNAWGVDIETCYAYCSRENFPMVFDFPIFTSGVTNYLLPWLGLTAQLPYETGSISGNFESFCLAVGSPMLSTFSLMSTALNAHSTSITFATKFGNGKTKSPLSGAIKSAEYFLCNSQQSPIRIKEDEFQRLFEEDTERLRDRWQPLKERLQKTRRQYTFSLFAQTFFAVIAWILTIVGSYTTSLGQHSEALLLSSGTLWTWLVPVVLGWMAVGTQSRKDAVREAIQGEILGGESAPIKALEAESGFINPPKLKQLHQALWSNVQGDEAHQGPAYNYARILTYPKLRDRIVDEFEKRRDLQNAQEIRADPSEPVDQVYRTNTTPVAAGSSHSIDEPYMTWRDVKESSDWKRNFIISNIVAMFLQWGIIGSAIVISYLTEVRGLGCRSGSYLLYGILATSAHVLLLMSVFLSHHVMLIYQTERRNGAPVAAHKVPRSTQIKWISRLAVLVRLLGKSTAVFNAIWIILSSVFELIGFYESCWCTGAVLGLGNRAWVVLFVSGDKLRDDAEASWIGGLAMSLFTMIFTYIFTKSYAQSKM